MEAEKDEQGLTPRVDADALQAANNRQREADALEIIKRDFPDFVEFKAIQEGEGNRKVFEAKRAAVGSVFEQWKRDFRFIARAGSYVSQLAQLRDWQRREDARKAEAREAEARKAEAREASRAAELWAECEAEIRRQDAEAFRARVQNLFNQKNKQHENNL